METATTVARGERLARLTARVGQIRGLKTHVEATLQSVERRITAADRFGADLVQDGCYPLRVRMNELRLERLTLTAQAVRSQLRRIDLLEGRTADRLRRLARGEPKSLRALREERALGGAR